MATEATGADNIGNIVDRFSSCLQIFNTQQKFERESKEYLIVAGVLRAYRLGVTAGA